MKFVCEVVTALPDILIPHVPDAPVPVVDGGVNPNAVVTSPDVNVTEPVLVLNDVTTALLDAEVILPVESTTNVG